MTTPFAYLSFDSDLPKMLTAIKGRKIQALMPRKDLQPCCEYAGPCVIGVLLPADERKAFDDYDAGDPSFANLVKMNVFEVSDWEFNEWNELQDAHDNLLTARIELHAANATNHPAKLETFHRSLRTFFKQVKDIIYNHKAAYHASI